MSRRCEYPPCTGLSSTIRCTIKQPEIFKWYLLEISTSKIVNL